MDIGQLRLQSEIRRVVLTVVDGWAELLDRKALGPILEFLRLLINLRVFYVVELAVVPDELDVVKAFFDLVVDSGVEILFNRSEVHHLLDNLRVVIKLKPDVVNGLEEDLRLLLICQNSQDLLQALDVGVVDGSSAAD